MLTSKFNNQLRTYQKFGASGVKLQALPEITNELVLEKQKLFGSFIYDRDDLEVEGVESAGPIEF